MRRALLLSVAVLALAHPAFAQEEEELSPEEDPDVVLSYDSWFLRLDVGVGYMRALTNYEPDGGGGEEQELELVSAAPMLELAVAGRLGRDVTLGGLGSLAHAPVTQHDGSWQSDSQGLYYAALFIDHRLPAKVLHIGAGVGPGYVYTFGPEEKHFGNLGPVGTAWLGVDLATSSRVAIGLVADFTGAAITDTHSIAGVRHHVSTFMMVLGLSFTIRISEPSFPDALPSVASAAPP